MFCHRSEYLATMHSRCFSVAVAEETTVSSALAFHRYTESTGVLHVETIENPGADFKDGSV